MNKYLRRTWRHFATAIIVIGGMSIVSSMHYEDEKKAETIFCARVLDGTWTNYKGLDCPKPKEDK